MQHPISASIATRQEMLIAQKAYAEAALAMCLFASSLFEDQRTHPDQDARTDASPLLNILTPVVKSWSAKYGCLSNEMAMQVLGRLAARSACPA